MYDKQVDIVKSVDENDETICVAGNMLGKDFISAFIALWWMCSRSPARVVLSSVDGDQLESVLWGEIKMFLDSAAHPLPLRVQHMMIRQIDSKGQDVPKAILECKVAKKGEGMLGRHLDRKGGRPSTLVIFDECSSMEDIAYSNACTWAHRVLMIGNAYECHNHFIRAVKRGSVKREGEPGYYSKIIKIKAEDSPNVQLGLAEVKAGKKPSGKALVPGVIGYKEYIKRRTMWDEKRQCIGLDAEFYEGANTRLFPTAWLGMANEFHLTQDLNRKGTAMGVDPAEGGDNTTWTIIDEYGIIEIVSEKTPNTAVIPLKTIQLMAKHGIEPEMVCFDAGGGKTHADQLRMKGYDVRSVGFGESPTIIDDPLEVEQKSNRMAFANLRAEMYWKLRELLDPSIDNFGEGGKIFGIGTDDSYKELIRQLTIFPLEYNKYGKFYLPPKRGNKGSKILSLSSMMGCSPDEADSLVLAVHAISTKKEPLILGRAL